MTREIAADRPRDSRVAAVAALLFAVALGAALLFLFSYPLPDAKNDAVEYLALARSVAGGEGFSDDGGATPAVYRPPLFSILLGAWFRLTGTSSVLSAAVFQSLLHGLGVAAAFLLFLEILPSRAWASGAALVLAITPLLVTRVAFVLQEPTVLLFTVLAAWASARLVRAPSPGRAALAGAAWGICALAKVVCWFAPFLLLAMRFLPERLRWSWRRREAACLLIGFILVIAPWTARNYVHFHRFIPVNAQGKGMLEWNVEHATPPGAPPGDTVLAELDRKGVRGKERQDALWRYVRQNMRYFLVNRTWKNASVFIRPPRDWWWSRGLYGPGDPRPWYWTLHDYVHWFLYLALAFRTVQWARGRYDPSFGFLILFYWAYWMEHAVVLGASRFGLAVYPLLLAMIPPRSGPVTGRVADGDGRLVFGPEGLVR